MQRTTSYDFDVISGPSTPALPPAPPTVPAPRTSEPGAGQATAPPTRDRAAPRRESSAT